MIERGEWLFDQGEFKEASHSFATATDAAHPTTIRGEGFLGLGRCELNAGNADRARTHLRSAAKLLDGTPRFGEALYHQGEAFIELHSVRNAIKTLDQAFAYLQDTQYRARAAYLLTLLYRAARNEEGVARYEPFTRGLDTESRELSYWRSKIHPTVVPTPGETFAATPRAPKKGWPTAATSVPIRSRSDWRARKMRRGAVAMGKVRAITIHHTGEASSPNVNSDGELRNYLRNMQRYAQSTKGWADIGYHYLIDSRGKVWEGRAASHQGAHAGNPRLNKGNIGIALIGNFERVKPTDRQLDTLQSLLQNLCVKHSVSMPRVYSHNQRRKSGGLGMTDCPGRYFAPLIPKIKKRLIASGALPSSLAVHDPLDKSTAPLGYAARFRDAVDRMHAADGECCPDPSLTTDESVATAE